MKEREREIAMEFVVVDGRLIGVSVSRRDNDDDSDGDVERLYMYGRRPMYVM
jgi:hypothetical protein